MESKEQVLKAEIYDLNKTINAQGNLLMAVCEALEISVAEGLDPQAVLEAIHALKGDKE
jgi:3-hydroxyisobutyrate dehydrogenase-like beta-hydroxyacid dehydrogenase